MGEMAVSSGGVFAGFPEGEVGGWLMRSEKA